jgi:uroporphyrin-III C-methyltransferase / precorrin-2 dehydrogenase / sirohydrochlorin ferrochelatase
MRNPPSQPEAGEAAAMPYFPIFLDLRGRKVLLVGGTEAAASKARLLARAGAAVTAVAGTLDPDLAALVRAGAVTWERRPFAPEMLEGAAIVIDGAGEPELTAAVRAAAAERNILVNVVDVPEACDFQVPAILDRSPIVVAVSTGGAAPALARVIRQRLEAAIPAGYAGLARAAQSCRGLVKERLAPGRGRQRFWDRVLAGPLADELMGMPEEAAAARIGEELARLPADPSEEPGSVTLAGAGPGDPGLLTLHAVQALESADVILHDALVPDGILGLARREARLLSVGKRAGRASVDQDLTNRMMETFARRGLRVLRLKGGDPFVFGRGGEEAAWLRERGIAVRVIPGISAAMGIAAELGLPLTHRGAARSLRLVTASCRTQAETAAMDWRSMADPGTTLAIYMGRDRIACVAEALAAAGLSPATPAVAVENGTRPGSRHRFAELRHLASTVRELDASAPVLVVIGDAVALAPGWSGRAGLPEPAVPAVRERLCAAGAC